MWNALSEPDFDEAELSRLEVARQALESTSAGTIAILGADDAGHIVGGMSAVKLSDGRILGVLITTGDEDGEVIRFGEYVTDSTVTS